MIVKVELKIQRARGYFAEITKVVETERLETDAKTRKAVELDYCNEYISRDQKTTPLYNLTDAKRIAGLKITSKII